MWELLSALVSIAAVVAFFKVFDWLTEHIFD
jgi:hypothetical protein